MNILPVLYLLIQVNILSAREVPSVLPISYFDALATNCPMINHTDFRTSMVKYGLFEKCLDWARISRTKSTTHDTEDSARCLLYFDSFVSFCKELKTANIKIIKLDILVPDLKNYTVDNFCKNLTFLLAHKEFEHNISQLMPNERICDKLCITYGDTIIAECSLAHYFANFNVTTLMHQEQTNAKSLPDLQPNKSIMALLPGTAILSDHISKEVKPQGGASQQNGPTGGTLEAGNNPKVSKSAPHSGNGDDSSTKEEKRLESKLSVPVDKQGTGLGTGEMGPPPPERKAADIVKGAEVPLVKDPAHSVDKTAKALTNEEANVPATHVEEPNSLGHIKTDKKDHLETNLGNEQNHLETNQEQPDMHKQDSVNLGAEEIDEMKPDDDYVENKDGPDNADGENVENNMDKTETHDEDKGEANNKQGDVAGEKVKQEENKPDKPETLESPAVDGNNENLGDSYFFSYFMVICVLFILGYVGYHNRQKVFALMLEGKRGKRQYRGRRPNSANYHKLDSNLEEAISSTCTKNSSHVIY